MTQPSYERARKDHVRQIQKRAASASCPPCPALARSDRVRSPLWPSASVSRAAPHARAAGAPSHDGSKSPSPERSEGSKRSEIPRAQRKVGGQPVQPKDFRRGAPSASALANALLRDPAFAGGRFYAITLTLRSGLRDELEQKAKAFLATIERRLPAGGVLLMLDRKRAEKDRWHLHGLVAATGTFEPERLKRWWLRLWPHHYIKHGFL